MQDLIKEYNAALRSLRPLMENASEEDLKHLSSMASDLRYALEWMRTGKRPGNRRGIERRAAYQREKPVDPLLMQRFFRNTDSDVYSWDDHLQEDVIGYWDKIRIEDALSTLTEKEKEIYLMAKGHGLSRSQIAKYLVVSKSTIQDAIERAEKKISKQISSSLFQVG
ncbi:sigma factor-like helix-turn-helix DNA-binding protein [Peribacillus frigoritolerans]|uniref:sigma factor-like helix-turn-helix DNA-binding protein n=1 Tax=Peribacillus frigoritolerans TaxID=450367 RepID=UPI003D03BB31